MDIMVFGVGNTGKLFLDKKFDKNNDNIVAAVDNNRNLWGKKVNGFQNIISVDCIKEYVFDYIVITSIYKDSISGQLEKIVRSEKVISVEDYERLVYTRKRYRDCYLQENIKRINVFSGRTAVYTAVTGDYDQLFDPLIVQEEYDYICFTNNRNLTSKVWNIEYLSDNLLSDMYLARKTKLFPNQVLKEYDTSIWLDGKFQIVGDLKEYISEYQKTSPVLCFPHFSRNCIYEEAARCIVDGIGYKPDIVRQISHYITDDYPFDNGLYETGCVVRRHNDDAVESLMEKWWSEICDYSYRDQISFPYVCWKNDFTPDICDQNIYRNKWLSCKRNYSKAFGSL